MKVTNSKEEDKQVEFKEDSRHMLLRLRQESLLLDKNKSNAKYLNTVDKFVETMQETVKKEIEALEENTSEENQSRAASEGFKSVDLYSGESESIENNSDDDYENREVYDDLDDDKLLEDAIRK